eukprot:gene1114-3947_t
MAIIGIEKKHTYNAATFQAIGMIAGLAFLFYAVMVKFHDEQIIHPGIMVFFPIICISFMAVLIPLMMFISYQDDFKGVYPLLPSDLFKIVVTCYKSMAKNNFKVDAHTFKQD